MQTATLRYAAAGRTQPLEHPLLRPLCAVIRGHRCWMVDQTVLVAAGDVLGTDGTDDQGAGRPHGHTRATCGALAETGTAERVSESAERRRHVSGESSRAERIRTMLPQRQHVGIMTPFSACRLAMPRSETADRHQLFAVHLRSDCVILAPPNRIKKAENQRSSGGYNRVARRCREASATSHRRTDD
jgi:hypothetical protein